MNAVNRGIMSLLVIAWIAALAGILVLVWDRSLSLNLEETFATLDFDVFAETRAEQILATIILGVLALPALMLLLFEVKPSGRRDEVHANGDRGREAALEARVDTLQRELDSERRGADKAVDKAVTYDDRDESAGRRRWRFFPRSNS